jgi:hypothetical protein
MNDTSISIDEVFEPSATQVFALLAAYTAAAIAGACTTAYIIDKLDERRLSRKKIAPVLTIA